MAPDDTPHDLYIQQNKFQATCAADVSPILARTMATAQRPIADTALSETAAAPAWKLIPPYFVFGTLDKAIPPAVQRFMAERAKAKLVLEIKGEDIHQT
ncbi:hypothetical protein [Deinococcus sp. UYEF24]